MMCRCPGSLLRILTFIQPPTMFETVLLPAVRHELPEPTRSRTREGLRFECALRLRQVDQVAGHALLGQHAANHFAVASRATQSILHNGAALGGLKEVQEGK